MNGEVKSEIQQLTHNNNFIKNERISPVTSITSPDNCSRSPSATPSTSSVPGTPPSGTTADMGNLTNRNYSDYMRSLAAKYNNSSSNSNLNNNNEFFNLPTNTLKHSMLDQQFSAPSFKFSENKNNKSTESPPLPKKHSLNLPGAYSDVLSSYGMIPPVIDMSCTQFLVNLVQKSKDNQRVKGSPSSGSQHSPSENTLIDQRIVNKFLGLTNDEPNKRLSASALDLSMLNSAPKRSRLSPSESPRLGRGSSASPSVTSINNNLNRLSNASPSPNRNTESSESVVLSWSVQEVVDFVSSIDICAEYAQLFKDESIDGTGLSMLTEEHLTKTMGMKLGPALKLKAAVAKKSGRGTCSMCLKCNHQNSNHLTDPAFLKTDLFSFNNYEKK